MRLSRLAVLAVASLTSACSSFEDLGGDRLKHIATYATSFKHNLSVDHNLLDRALSQCSEGTAKAETTCVKDALKESAMSPADLAKTIPGCKLGQVCGYDHETRRKLGIVEATAVLLVQRWHVEVDLKAPVSDLSLVAVTVADQDQFATDEPENVDQTPRRICKPHAKGPFACP